MNENIIAIDIPNAVSIVIMAALGALVYAGIKKLLMGKWSPGSTAGMPGQNTTLYGMAGA